jgi:hypothetical protein
MYCDRAPFDGTAILPVSGNKKVFTGSDAWLKTLSYKKTCSASGSASSSSEATSLITKHPIHQGRLGNWLVARYRDECDLKTSASGILHSGNPKTCDEFSRLQRRIDMTQRHYRNTLHELQRLQAEQAEETAPARDSDSEPVRLTPPAATSKSEIGFVPQLTPDDPAASPPDPLLR